MTFRWFDRWGPLAGPLGVMSFVVAILLYGNGPKDDDQKIWWSTFDGRSWAPQQAVPDVGTATSAALSAP